MKRAQSELLAASIYHFYENNGNYKINETVKHFVQEGHNNYTVRRILKRCIERNTSERFPVNINPPILRTNDIIGQVQRVFSTNPNISVRQAAKQLNISRSTVQRIKRENLGLSAYTKKKAPKQNPTQKTRAKAGCRHVLYRSRGRAILMDDETYVHLDSSQVPGRNFYHSNGPNGVKKTI